MLPDYFFLSFCVFLVVWLNAWMELREPSRMANFHITYILSSNIDLIYTSAKNCRRISKSHTIGGLLASRRHRGYRTWTSLRSEVLKASHFLVFLSVPTPDSLWPAHIFFYLSDSEERLHFFSILHLKASPHLHFMTLMGITRGTLFMCLFCLPFPWSL